MSKQILIEVIKGWNEGPVLQPGQRIHVDESRAKAMIRLGYAKRVDPDAPYDFPSSDPKNKFQKVVLDEPEEAKPKEISVSGHAKVEDFVSEIPALIDLGFLRENQVEELGKHKIHTLLDLKKWNAEKLVTIKFIGPAAAGKLMDAYDSYVNVDHHKDSDLELNEK